ncbi:MAG: zinc-binding dehydrogenase, partial [Bacteroidales bacterium]
IVVDIDKNKLDQALHSGAAAGFEAADDQLSEKILKLSHQRGADLSFEVVGITESVNTAINVLRRGGRTVLIGNLSKSVSFPLQKVVTGEISVLSSCAIRGEYEAVLSLIEKEVLNVKDQISAVAPLSEGAAWFDRLKKPDNKFNKVILVP